MRYWMAALRATALALASTGGCAGNAAVSEGDGATADDRTGEVAKAARSAAPLAAAAIGGAPVPSASTVVVDPDLRRPTAWRADRSLGPAERIRRAERARLPVVRELFDRASVAWPPRQLLFRVFKQEDELEVWASGDRSGRLHPIARYEVCYASGKLGPKRREGDRQVPEGYYQIGRFNPESAYHLAMLVSYPNASDRVLSHPRHPGGEILIHGACVSIGCVSMSDERAEELWLMARAAPAPVHVHILPARDMTALLADETRATHHDFWQNLAEGQARFERDHVLPRYRVGAGGRYLFEDRAVRTHREGGGG
jgi:hypothetical protein